MTTYKSNIQKENNIDIKKILTPNVTIIIPMYNEQDYIGRCIKSLINQDYEKDKYDIIVADGRSTDKSADIVQRLARWRRITLLNNEAKIASAGLNIGIKHSKADIIIILGAHSYVPYKFISQNVRLLDETGADCVGGQIETIGEEYISKAASIVMSCYFGVGGPKFRCGGKKGYVDTVAFGAYRRDVFKKIGLFDETLLRGLDAEFNYRLRHHGGKIFFDPSIIVSYYNKTSVAKLWIQYFRAGYWKVEIAKRYPKAMQYRQFVPFLFILTVLFAGVLAIYGIALPLFILFCLYAVVSLGFSIRLALAHELKYFPILPLIFLVIHVSYGLGFLLGLKHFLTIKEDYTIS